ALPIWRAADGSDGGNAWHRLRAGFGSRTCPATCGAPGTACAATAAPSAAAILRGSTEGSRTLMLLKARQRFEPTGTSPADEPARPEEGGRASSNTFQGIDNLGASLSATPRGGPKRGSFAAGLIAPKTPLGRDPLGNPGAELFDRLDRKSTRLNSSHVSISY